MQTQIKQWGNSQGIRLSREILQIAGLDVDDTLDVNISDGKIVLSKPYHHITLEERAADFGGKLGFDGEYDWGEEIGREVWE